MTELNNLKNKLAESKTTDRIHSLWNDIKVFELIDFQDFITRCLSIEENDFDHFENELTIAMETDNRCYISDLLDNIV